MAKNNLLTLIGCAVFCLAGLAMMASNLHVVRDGIRLFASEEKVVAAVVEKKVERPARKPGVRAESISVNGNKARALHTYFNSYFAIVSEPTGAPDTKMASISYDAWHNLEVGTELEVYFAPNVSAFVDVSSGATLRYGLKQIGIGFAIVLLGVGVLFIPSENDDQPDHRYS